MLHNSRFKTFVWYSGVGLLVLLAVAVTVFRLAFSSVEEYRAQLETLAGNYLGQPVTISGINARVAGISPTVVLSDVALLHKDSSQPLTRFAAIDIALDPIMNPWDIAALVPVVRGAGGTITDWSGNSPYPAESIIASATPELHTATLAVLQS